MNPADYANLMVPSYDLSIVKSWRGQGELEVLLVLPFFLQMNPTDYANLMVLSYDLSIVNSWQFIEWFMELNFMSHLASLSKATKRIHSYNIVTEEQNQRQKSRLQ